MHDKTSKLYNIQDIFPKKIIYNIKLAKKEKPIHGKSFNIDINITSESQNVKDDFFVCNGFNKVRELL
jgi:hypothetical protein